MATRVKVSSHPRSVGVAVTGNTGEANVECGSPEFPPPAQGEWSKE